MLYIFFNHCSCLANQNTSRIQNQGLADDCELESRPSMTITQVHLIAVFGAGVAVSSWVWTKASVLAWRRWYRRYCVKIEWLMIHVGIKCPIFRVMAYLKLRQTFDS